VELLTKTDNRNDRSVINP